MLPSPPSPLPQQSSPEEAPGRGTPALVHPERGMRQDSRHTQRGKLAVRTTHTGRRHSPGRTCGHVRRWICCYSQHTRAHMLTQACAQRERPQPSSSLPPPPPQCSSTQAHTDRCVWGYTDTHTDLHTHSSSTPSISFGWRQLCSPYGAQIQLGCPGVWLWGGAGASVPGDSPSASLRSPPSEDSYHTPRRGLASHSLAQDLYRSCWL